MNLNGWHPDPNQPPLWRHAPLHVTAAGPRWRWYHKLAYRVGCWFDALGRRLRGMAP